MIRGFFLLIFFYFLFTVPYSYAATATQSAKTASDSSKLATLKDKIEALKKEVASKAANLKLEINQKLQNKAFVGQVTEITNSKIAIENRAGAKIIVVDEYTLYQDTTAKTKKKAVTQKDFAKGDYIASLGDVDDKNVMTAKKVTKLSKTNFDQKETQIVWGQVVSVNGHNITIKDSAGRKKEITASNAQFKLGTADSSILDAKVNKFLAAVVLRNNARFIYFIPSMGYIKPEKTASSSAAKGL